MKMRLWAFAHDSDFTRTLTSHRLEWLSEWSRLCLWKSRILGVFILCPRSLVGLMFHELDIVLFLWDSHLETEMLEALFCVELVVSVTKCGIHRFMALYSIWQYWNSWYSVWISSLRAEIDWVLHHFIKVLWILTQNTVLVESYAWLLRFHRCLVSHVAWLTKVNCLIWVV